MAELDMTATARIINKLLAERGWNGVDLAHASGVKQSTAFSILSGKTKDLKVSNLLKIAQTLGVSVESLLGIQEQKVVALDVDELPPEDYVQIPEYRVKFGCGDCSEPTFEEANEVRPATYHLSYFSAIGINPQNCIRLKAEGDSMVPLICDGDTVLIDTSQTTIVDGKIYAFLQETSLRIKRLRRVGTTKLALISENPDVERETITLDDNLFFKIIGRVIERSGTLNQSFVIVFSPFFRGFFISKI